VKEARITINGVELTEAQSMAVRVAVTGMRMDLHADDRKRMRGLGEIGHLYDLRLQEVEDLITF